MKNIIIYTRVSTDEQADKGFSLISQKQILNHYCSSKNYNILEHFQEDYSAKTFDRPEWRKLMAYCKANKKEIDSVFFTKWDRFSRNAGESYQVINKLKNMGINVNAIEQPLDFDTPDTKIMLAVYLAFPEVENDKIAIRTIEGTREANKAGCWTGIAPMGYKNHRNEDGKSTLISSEKADYIAEAFQLIADTKMPIEEARRTINKKGLKVGKTHFNNLIRNKVYIGKVKVRQRKDEDEYFVDGLHSPIITQNLFNTVQDIISGRKKVAKKWSTKDENLPLRGFVECSRCGNKLTGSASTGRHGGKFYYYHCRGGCKERISASKAHLIFDDLLNHLTPDEGIIELYTKVLKERIGGNKEVRKRRMNSIKEEMDSLEKTIQIADNNLFEGRIDQNAFNRGKARYVKRIADLQLDYLELKNTSSHYMKRIQGCLDIFKNLRTLYQTSDWEAKRELLGSTFSEKIIFEENKCRTPRLNSLLVDIHQATSKLVEKKSGQIKEILNLSAMAARRGLHFTYSS